VSLRAVIDTNIWVSAIINPTGYPARLRKAFEKGIFEVVVSEPILQEIAEVLWRPRIRIKYGITEEDIKELLTLIEERADYALVSGSVNICRDKDDNFIIETAITGNAAYIVSRDDDVKFDKAVSDFLSQYNISTITVAKFLKLLE
jgi:putative PIN family toxin of toxin-antitoxin system